MSQTGKSSKVQYALIRLGSDNVKFMATKLLSKKPLQLYVLIEYLRI